MAAIARRPVRNDERCWVTRVDDDDDDDDDDNDEEAEEEEVAEETEEEEFACRRGNKQTDTLPFDSVETTTDGKVCRSPQTRR
ncbi:hypothetical protein K0M31_003164 [Melipona bicolor]|uniref:Uncharacterized protein n=1 Tax=Melipona bicolor TaxID=60889 RepID=A0AA40FYC4_9HYME|nr:hypothetical protein K0M31_003164 [Melipona bicolor]